jgi:hypothetical protein
LVGLWLVVSLARFARVIEPPEPPPGQTVAPMLDFLRANIPSEAGFVYVLPDKFGSDTGEAPRLRYELYPRAYDDVRATQDESSIRRIMIASGLRFIVVPDAQRYEPSYFLRQPRDWLRRIDFDPDRYLLEILS